jgi:hypothetical protein
MSRGDGRAPVPIPACGRGAARALASARGRLANQLI